MESLAWIPDTLGLVSHTLARDKCIARKELKAGSQVLLTSAYTTTLLGSEKGRRCDFCLSLSSDTISLKRCTGCGSYWYCNEHCQIAQWKAHHKRICKLYNLHIVSSEYQALPDYRKLDSTLLSHVIAQLSLLPVPYDFQESIPSSLLVSLLPCQNNSVEPPPICPIKPIPPHGLLRKLYARFGNNHFAIHSHLNTVAHGIFPQASRLFNHSCLPNAAAKYIFSKGEPPRMEVVALRDILEREEVCLPYLDPALLETREQMLELSYGFQCDCPTSLFLHRISPLPEVPATESGIDQISRELREFVGFDATKGFDTLPKKSLESLPPSLHCVLRESYMTRLSEEFSKASHEGQHDTAIQDGISLLSLYLLIYPLNYPQIGMHLLEMAKTTWNAVITSADQDSERPLKEQARRFLVLARYILNVFGPEGDDDGPLQEIAVLDALL